MFYIGIFIKTFQVRLKKFWLAQNVRKEEVRLSVLYLQTKYKRTVKKNNSPTTMNYIYKGYDGSTIIINNVITHG